MKELDVLTKEEQRRLRSLDEALSMLDLCYFSIQSKIRRLMPRFREEDQRNVDSLKELGLRVQGLYQQLIEGEIAIIESIVDYYLAFHGPYREQSSRDIDFDRTSRGRRGSSRVTSLFHTFTVEFSSVLDMSLNLVLTLARRNLPSGIPKRSSYGGFVNLVQRDLRLRHELEEHPLFALWLKYEGLMTSIKNRRDQLVHHQFVQLLSSARTELEHVELEFWSPEVYRLNRDTFEVKRGIILRYNQFCRAALYALFKVLSVSLAQLERINN
jgi:hypothetical protein